MTKEKTKEIYDKNGNLLFICHYYKGTIEYFELHDEDDVKIEPEWWATLDVYSHEEEIFLNWLAEEYGEDVLIQIGFEEDQIKSIKEACQTK